MISGPVVVCPDPSAAGHRALRWAADAARRRHTALHVVVAAQRGGRARRCGVFSDALAAVRDAVPGLPVLGRASRGPVPGALAELSADAGVLVVPATSPDVAAVVAGSFCPVAVVPRSDQSPEAEHGPVVLADAPWTGEDVIARAFEEASARRAPLLAVRTWTEPGIDLGLPRPDRIAEWDRTEDQARRELEFALSPWRVIHPDVGVESFAVQDEATEFLVALSYRARLLVVGRSARGALLGGISESPVAVLLRAARCPVLVVPPEGPPRTTWLPSRERGWAFTAR